VQIQVFWNVMPWRVVNYHRRFGRSNFLPKVGNYLQVYMLQFNSIEQSHSWGFWFGKLREGDHLDGRIILKWIFKKWGGDRWRALLNGVLNLRNSHNATRCKFPPKIVFHVVGRFHPFTGHEGP